MPNSTESLTTALQEWTGIFIHRAQRNIYHYAKKNHLSMSQMGALLRLHKQGVCSVSDISSDLGITSAAVSQMLERMVQQGLIERTENPNDRRAKQIALTDKGRNLLREGFRAHRSWLSDLARTLPPDEQTQATDALRLLIEHAKQFEVTTIRNS